MVLAPGNWHELRARTAARRPGSPPAQGPDRDGRVDLRDRDHPGLRDADLLAALVESAAAQGQSAATAAWLICSPNSNAGQRSTPWRTASGSRCTSQRIWRASNNLGRRLADMPATGGNEVRILAEADTTYAALEDAMRAARHHIHMEYYIWQPDETGHSFRDLVIERARAGIECRLLLDAVGCWRLGREFLRPLIKAGVRVAFFLPLYPFHSRKRWSLHLRNHRKLVVVDGQTAFMGSQNIGDEYPRPLQAPEPLVRHAHAPSAGRRPCSSSRSLPRTGTWPPANGWIMSSTSRSPAARETRSSKSSRPAPINPSAHWRKSSSRRSRRPPRRFASRRPTLSPTSPCGWPWHTRATGVCRCASSCRPVATSRSRSGPRGASTRSSSSKEWRSTNTIPASCTPSSSPWMTAGACSVRPTWTRGASG